VERSDLRELARIKQAVAVVRAAEARRNPAVFSPQKPTIKQAEFLGLDCKEALYGGAAGGGKSSALLMGALQHVNVRGYSALLLRKSFRDLDQPEALIPRSHEWLDGTGAKWNEQKKRWTFPSGATLTFGYCETYADVQQYQGAAFQYVGVDELTQWEERTYRYLLSRLRRPKDPKNPLSSVPLRARAGANPGGIGHKWVGKRFIESTDPQRRFVPALLDDNPHLDAESYIEQLDLLDETTRQQLRFGKWIQDTSTLVAKYDGARNLIATLPRAMQSEWFYLLGMDFGVRDSTAWVVLAWRRGDRRTYVVESDKRAGMDPEAVGFLVTELTQRYPFTQIVGDLGGAGLPFGVHLQNRFSIPIVPAKKLGRLGNIMLMNGALERGNLVVLGPTNAKLTKELEELPWADEEHQETADGHEDHLFDALLYGFTASPAHWEREPSGPEARADVIKREEAAMETAAEDEAERQAGQEWWET
jgi:hypothetical protein